MEKVLDEILREVKGIKQSVSQLEEKMDRKFKEIEIKVDKRFEQVDKRFVQVDKRFEQVDKRFMQVDKRFEDQEIKFDKKLTNQYNDISQEFRELINYLEEKFKNQDKVNQEILRELRENRIAHESYDARLFKIEIAQSNLEKKFYEFSKQKGFAV